MVRLQVALMTLVAVPAFLAAAAPIASAGCAQDYATATRAAVEPAALTGANAGVTWIADTRQDVQGYSIGYGPGFLARDVWDNTETFALAGGDAALAATYAQAAATDSFVACAV